MALLASPSLVERIALSGTVHCVSGIPLGGISGTGQLLSRISAEISQYNLPMKLHCPLPERAIRGLFRQGKIFEAFYEPVRRRNIFREQTRMLKVCAQADEPLILFHPPRLGWRDVIEALQLRKGFTWIFVLDCFFFCRRGYNIVEPELAPCFRCVTTDGEPGERLGCPVVRSHHFDSGFFKQFAAMVRAGKIGFLAQTAEHAQLVGQHFQCSPRIEVVGLDLPEMDIPTQASTEAGYDMVYHGAASWEKGLGIALSIARDLPEFSMLIPASSEHVLKVLPDAVSRVIPSNVTCKPLNWGTGLKEALLEAKLSLCPSIWAAPIEGAVLKSMKFGGIVALLRGHGQFGKEIPQNACIEIDPARWDASITKLRETLQNAKLRQAIRAEANGFLNSFIDANKNFTRRLCQIALSRN